MTHDPAHTIHARPGRRKIQAAQGVDERKAPAGLIRPNDPGLVICPAAALARPAGDGDRIQVANRVRKIHLIESIKELRAELAPER